MELPLIELTDFPILGYIPEIARGFPGIFFRREGSCAASVLVRIIEEKKLGCD